MSEYLSPDISNTLIVYNYTDETLIKLREQAKDVRLTGFDDIDGLAKVRETRLQLKAVRIAIDKRRKELKEDALRFGQKVDSEAKRLIGMIEPQERRLEEEEQSVARELERQRAEVEARKREKAEVRMREVQAVQIPGDTPNMLAIVEMQDEQYEATLRALTHARQAWDAEQRRAIEQVEQERLQRLDEERRMREQREADDRARAAERKAIEDARAEIARQQKEERDALELREREHQARVAREEQKQRDEAARLQAVREQQERERDEIEAKRAAVAAEEARIEREKEEALPVPAEECRVCPTCGQPWNGGAP